MSTEETAEAPGPSPDLPERAHVVIVGGGVIGSSIAYHLAQLGWSDVVLLERDRLTSGTTWHAAGLVATFGSMSETSTEMRLYTRDLYGRLEAETGFATGFSPIGFVELATEPDRLEEYRRVAAFNRYCGVDVEEVSPSEVAALFPAARTDDVLAGFYVAGDGRVNPVDVTMSLARGARSGGVRIVESVPVTGFLVDRSAVVGVTTDHGDIEAEYVVNCAGMWARQLGEIAGVAIPLQAAEHYYLLTEPIGGVSRDWPVIEDPASYGYYREESGGLMVGLFEPVAAPWMVDGIPGTFSFGELTPDWDRMAPYVETALGRVPIALETGIRKLFCGPESFTPDLQPVVGEAPELKNYFVVAGLNSVGITTGGGLGRIVAHWIADGDPGVDVTGFDIDRLRRYQADPDYLRERTVESLGLVYRCHYPTRAMETAREVKLSPLHDRLARRGAFFREVSGWEAPDWYAPPGEDPVVERLSWGRQNWFPYWRAEHEAARTGVIVMDMSFMSKFTVDGAGAGPLLERLSANRVDGDPGVITYTQWLNDRGTIEADLTVTKLDDARFWVVATDTAHRHVETRLRRTADVNGGGVTITDVTDRYAQINVQGPRSRELLQMVADADVSGEAFPFRAAREIAIGSGGVLCVRITYVGELGYELYVPAPEAADVYDRIVAAGRSIGLVHAGLRALGSLRMEKGYRDYGHDIDNTDTVFEAGLGFAVDLSKPDFVGRDAVVEQMASRPPQRRLVQVLVQDPEPLMHHGEVVHGNGSPVGYVRAASYGFTLGGAVGLAMIDPGEPVTRELLADAEWEVDIAGARHPVIVSIRPLYDPTSGRVRA